MMELYAALGAMVAVLLGAFGLYRKGKGDQKRETALEAAERYAKTTKEMQDAANSVDGDSGVLREWLSERGKPGGSM